MQRYTVYLYLETALHVSGGTSTHHQERIRLYLQHLVFVTPLVLSAAIVEELEPVWVCCGWRTPPAIFRIVSQYLNQVYYRVPPTRKYLLLLLSLSLLLFYYYYLFEILV